MKKLIIIICASFILVASLFLFEIPSFKFPRALSGPLEEAKRISEVCRDINVENDQHQKCLAREFADIGEQKGVGFIGQTLTAYQQLASSDKGYEDCHILSHRIMNDLVSRNAGDWKEVIKSMEGQLDPNRCGGGFLHGTIEVLSGIDQSFRVSAPLFDELCTEVLGGSSSCAHTLGHLALVESLGAINEAQKACQGLAGDYLFQCYGGIFMEDTMRTNLKDHGLAELPVRNMEWFNTQFARCNKYQERTEMIDGCWYVLSEVFMQTHDFDLEKTEQFCKSAPLKSAQDECYIRASYLFSLLPDYILGNFPAKEICSAYESQSKELIKCMQTVVGALLNYSVNFADRAVAFCSERPNFLTERCFNQVASQISIYPSGLADKKLICSKLPENNRNLCLGS